MTVSTPQSLRIAMIGTRGVPARYGGFETAIEEVGRRLADRGHRVLVYSRNPDASTPLPRFYRGMRVIELPAMRRRSLETLSHTGASIAHLLPRVHPDVAFVFNAANSPFLPALRAARIPVARMWTAWSGSEANGARPVSATTGRRRPPPCASPTP